MSPFSLTDVIESSGQWVRVCLRGAATMKSTSSLRERIARCLAGGHLLCASAKTASPVGDPIEVNHERPFHCYVHERLRDSGLSVRHSATAPMPRVSRCAV